MSLLQDPAWLQARRRQAAQLVAQLGLPDTSMEDWKYTNSRDLMPATRAASHENLQAIVDSVRLENTAALLVFVGGIFSDSLSRLGNLPRAFRVLPLSRAVEQAAPEVSAWLGFADPANHALLALNRERWTDGLFLQVDAGQELSEPIQIVDIASGSSWLRHLVILGSKARATVIETNISADDIPVASHSVLEATLPEDAHLEHIRLQRGGNQSSLYAAQVAQVRTHASFTSRVLGLGGAHVRTEAHVVLQEPFAHAEVSGLVAVHQSEKVDAFTSIRHASPDCTSNELWKNLAGGSAQASFHGQVWVDVDAQRTAARQSNRNLLLSREASVNARPQLEIWADDVKCSHGSATGRLDEKALFFLRSRGLGPVAAKAILVRAFAGELLEQIAHEGLRAQAQDLLESRL